MKKSSSRPRIIRRDVLRGMARSRVRVWDLQKKVYPKEAYDGHDFDPEE